MSGGGNTTQTQEFKPPEYTRQPWENYVNQMVGLTGTPLTPYQGPTVAPMNFSQNTAGDMLYNMTTGGTPAGNAANAQITAQALGAIGNPYATTANPYMGDNPYLDGVINSSNKNITDAYSRGTAAQTDAAANRSRAFGGSAYDELTAANNKGLAEALAANTSGLRSQNYYNSSNLAENSLNRATSAFQNQQQNALNAAGLGLQSQGMDLNAINALMGYGNQQQLYGQSLLNAGQNQYNQNQMAPFTTLDMLGNALGRASGTGGSSSTSVPGQSPWGNLLGGGLLLGSLFGL